MEQRRQKKLLPRPPCGLHCIKMKDIGVKAGKSVIIEHVNLHIHCGRLTVIIGRNGAGKSTLIKAVLGEIRHSGTIEFRDMRNRSIQDLRIGYVPQHLNIEKNTPTSVYDMFASYISNVPVFFRKSRSLEQRIRNSLELFQAQDLVDKQLCDLSGGELQRVLLSIACKPVPNLLLLDEPVSGIDQNGMELFYHNLAMLKKNYDLAMVLVSHDLDFVEKYADSVILLDRTVLKEGTPKQVFTSDAFKEIFGSTEYRMKENSKYHIEENDKYHMEENSKYHVEENDKYRIEENDKYHMEENNLRQFSEERQEYQNGNNL